jgi:hypothetical protein
MRGAPLAVPLAVPLAWTNSGSFFLQVVRFEREIGSDCLRHRGFVR